MYSAGGWMRYREWCIIYDGKIRYTSRLSRDGYLPEHSTLHGMIVIECELIGFGGLVGLRLRVCCQEGWLIWCVLGSGGWHVGNMWERREEMMGKASGSATQRVVCIDKAVVLLGRTDIRLSCVFWTQGHWQRNCGSQMPPMSYNSLAVLLIPVFLLGTSSRLS